MDENQKRRETFIKLVAEGYPRQFALDQAGYKDASSGTQLMNNPKTLREIQARELSLFYGAAVPLATRRLMELLGDDDTPKDLYIRAARTVFERADRLADQLGLVAVEGEKARDMSIHDLEALVMTLKSKVAGQVIDLEPVPDVDTIIGK
jgi:hypothetical protein